MKNTLTLLAGLTVSSLTFAQKPSKIETDVLDTIPVQVIRSSAKSDTLKIISKREGRNEVILLSFNKNKPLVDPDLGHNNVVEVTMVQRDSSPLVQNGQMFLVQKNPKFWGAKLDDGSMIVIDMRRKKEGHVKVGAPKDMHIKRKIGTMQIL